MALAHVTAICELAHSALVLPDSRIYTGLLYCSAALALPDILAKLYATIP
jgi:hypothetical protein